MFFEPMPWQIRSEIEEKFEESNLPYTVDLVDGTKIEESFKNTILRERIKIEKSA